MFSLNKKGWGFVPFLILLTILIFALFLTSFLVNDFEKSLEKKKENILTSKELEVYKNYEILISNEAIKHYTDDEIVPISVLPISNAIKSECSGYAKKAGNIYKAYISCGRYTTIGYSDGYLNENSQKK